MIRLILTLTVFLLQLVCMQGASAAENNVSVALHAFKVVTTAAGTRLVPTDAEDRPKSEVKIVKASVVGEAE